MKLQKGFTLLEILLCVAMIGIIGGITAPLYNGLLIKNDLDIAVTTTAHSFRRAQILSQGMNGDSTWGVKIITGNIIIFKGTSYVSRDVLFDEITQISPNINVGGTTEVVFSKLSGLPVPTGAVSVSTINDSKQISINSEGMVNF